MRDKLGEQVRLAHIQEAIDYIKSFTAGKVEQDFIDEPMMRFAVVKQLEIIGEAFNHVSAETKQKAPSIDWRKIKAFRNISVHEYFGIDSAIIFKIVFSDVPELESALSLLITPKN